jgi:hypothetical protein
MNLKIEARSHSGMAKVETRKSPAAAVEDALVAVKAYITFTINLATSFSTSSPKTWVTKSPNLGFMGNFLQWTTCMLD